MCFFVKKNIISQDTKTVVSDVKKAQWVNTQKLVKNVN